MATFEAKRQAKKKKNLPAPSINGRCSSGIFFKDSFVLSLTILDDMCKLSACRVSIVFFVDSWHHLITLMGSSVNLASLHANI